MAKNLLLISNDPVDQAFASVVAETAGLMLKIAPNVKTAGEYVLNDGAATIFVDGTDEKYFSSFEQVIQETVGIFSDKVNANTIHFLSGKPIDQVTFLMKSPLFGHYVQKNYGDVSKSGVLYGRLVKSTLQERAFGLQNMLKEGTKVQNIKLAKSTMKQDAVEAVRNYLLSAKFSSRIATQIANAVDELLMNSIYDAPVDEMGKQIHVSVARNTPIDLTGQHAVEMNIAYDGGYVAITAVDHYGSLDKARMLSFISKIYTNDEYKVKTSVAGAGIGLATVFRMGGSFFFVSESRTRTEVSVFFRKTASFKEFKDQFRFISTQFYF